MAKTFKRIAALALALTLVVCFAVSASAAPTVATTTQYVTGSNEGKVNVTVSITDSDAPDYVTYYATKGSKDVYIDQVDLSSGSATIKYQTAAGDLGGTVKVGYTNGAAFDESIDSYTVSAGIYEVTPSVIPNSGTVTVTISGYVASENMKFKNVSAEGATVTSSVEESGIITVVLSNPDDDVELTVNEEPNKQPVAATATHLASAGVTVTTDTDDEYADAGNTRITVIGAVTGVADNDFGVIISNTEISAYDANKAWKAEVKNDKGAFAVQIIDDGILFEAGTYYTAVYAKSEDGTYTISAGNSFTVGQ